MSNKNSSRSLTSRQRAREAMAADLARAKQREDSLSVVFAALDKRNLADVELGRALRALLDLGDTRAHVAELTGLSSREVSGCLAHAREYDSADDHGNDEHEVDSQDRATVDASGDVEAHE